MSFRPFVQFFYALRRNDRGAIAVIFAIFLLPMIIAVGVGIDYARASQLKMALQNAVDAAALSGATAFIDSTTTTTASTVATTYMNAAISNLPANTGVTFTVTPTVLASSAGYTVAVTATSAVSTTFMKMFKPTLPVAVAAKAIDPIVTANVSTGQFNSSACDANSIYWYNVPSDGSVPASTALNALYTNNATKTWTATPNSFQVPAGQQIGFALQNITGTLCSYGTNGYGGKVGSTHWFYSHLSPPSSSAYPTVTSNCNLQVLAMTSSTLPTPTSGSCFSTTTSTTTSKYAAPTCSQLNGKQMEYAWNDMGGSSDDKDYNDAVYTFTCSSGGASSYTNATGVVLLN